MTAAVVLTRYRLTIEGTSPSALRELSGACEALDGAQVLQAKLERRKGCSIVYLAFPGSKEDLAQALGAQTNHDPDLVEYGEPIDAEELRRQLAEAKANRHRTFMGRTAVVPSEGRRP
jgi:hypothetical protein